MKPKIYYSDWNPFEGKELEYPKSVSISVDTLSFDSDSEIKILYLAEPASVYPLLNENFPKEFDQFDKIYTFNQKVLDTYSQSEFIEFGSCWLNFETLKIDKKDHITFVTSSKNMTTGHKLRHQVYNYLKNIDDLNGFEIYQHKSPPYHDNRNDFFDKSKFHISVENSIQENYFTEKIIDCFASKTIPIYCGCPNIDKFFNKDGIITFHNMESSEPMEKIANERLDKIEILWRKLYNRKIAQKN